LENTNFQGTYHGNPSAVTSKVKVAHLEPKFKRVWSCQTVRNVL